MGTRLDGWRPMDVEAIFAGIVVPVASTMLAMVSETALKGLKGGNRIKGIKGRKGASSLRRGGRTVVIASTAAIPWMTGTAVNPCLRAAYLANGADVEVVLLLPWLAEPDQATVFPAGLRFSNPEEQEAHIRAWLLQRTGFLPNIRISFYPGRYDRTMLGIFPVGDITSYVPEGFSDVAILEEPEHLTWFHHGPRWTDRFRHVVGIMHTNYAELGRRNAGLALSATSMAVNHLLCAIHCHKVIKLSDAVQALPRQVTSCVHGVAGAFLEVGAVSGSSPSPRFQQGAYCLGKLVWGKGWEELLDLMTHHQARCAPDSGCSVDAYGDGEARATIEAQAVAVRLPLNFHGKRDHMDPSLHGYQVFINASTSDVVATTSLEALAMGKWLICAAHPCNHFVSTFGNALLYRSKSEFSQHLEHALAHEPAPLTPSDLWRLSWQAATERLIDAAEIQEGEWPHPLTSAVEGLLWKIYNTVIGNEAVREAVCAGRNTSRSPSQVTDYIPCVDGPRRTGPLSWLREQLAAVRITARVGPLLLGLQAGRQGFATESDMGDWP